MSRLSQWHEQLNENGEGKCSVPMWMQGCPAGFCDDVAYGMPEHGQNRYGGYSSGLVCWGHGGPNHRQHMGDPCQYCGTPHGDVGPGPCPGKPVSQPPADGVCEECGDTGVLHEVDARYDVRTGIMTALTDSVPIPCPRCSATEP